jgi:hypothetical protein
MTHWDDDSFGPIAGHFDAMFRDKGRLHEHDAD